jgi:peptidoglycan hydrolase-like protein with peptidoglycan-binding domain
LNSTRTKRLAAPAVLLLMSASLSVPAPAQDAKPAAKTHKVSHHATKKARKPSGQQAIDGERARQIQTALVREHYMNSEPSGKWDDSTQAAMRRYQADQGWQSKSTPDSRALIRLGLGPDHGHLLNPESAMVSEAQLSGGTASIRARAPAAIAVKPPAAPRNSSPVSLPATAMPNVSPSR